MTQIIKQVSDHPILKRPRAIRLKQITYIDFDIKEARVVWEELFLDTAKVPIKDETVSNRIITSDISNSNKVDQYGIVIDSENFPKEKTESDEDYKIRMDGMLESGFPEFDFYIGAVINSTAILQAVDVLDNLKRYNRK